MVYIDSGWLPAQKNSGEGIRLSCIRLSSIPFFRMSLVFSTFRGGRQRSFIVHTPFRDTFAKTVCIYTLILPSKSNLFAEPGCLELLSPGLAVLKARRVSGWRSSGGAPAPCDNSQGSRDSQSGEKAWRPADSAQGYREGTIHSRLWTE